MWQQVSFLEVPIQDLSCHSKTMQQHSILDRFM